MTSLSIIDNEDKIINMISKVNEFESQYDFNYVADKASMLAMQSGADFIKTSTGKNAIGASPNAALTMCLAIRNFYEKTGKFIGLKVAGGIVSESDAVLYYTIFEKILGSTISLAYRNGNINATYFIIKHFVQIIAGFLIIYIIHKMPYKIFAVFTEVFLFISIATLICTLFKGMNKNEASRWIEIFGISFQTSEFAKIALLMYVAKQLNKKGDVIHDFKKGVLPIIIPVFVVCGLIVSENLSTAAIVSFILLFIGRVKLKHLALILGVGLVLGIFTITAFIAYAPNKGRISTWEKRIERFVSSNENQNSGKNIQVLQSKIAIASGEL